MKIDFSHYFAEHVSPAYRQASFNFSGVYPEFISGLRKVKRIINTLVYFSLVQRTPSEIEKYQKIKAEKNLANNCTHFAKIK